MNAGLNLSIAIYKPSASRRHCSSTRGFDDVQGGTFGVGKASRFQPHFFKNKYLEFKVPNTQKSDATPTMSQLNHIALFTF
jgi:hypothetical protein